MTSVSPAIAEQDLSRQPVFEMTWQEQQSRGTTFFRLFTALPGLFFLSLWSIALWVTVPISWFVLIFTGNYPRSLYDFHASFARYATYVYSYFYLATDRWPGFSGDPAFDYPEKLHLGEPLAEYSRMKVLFRIIIGIPVYLIAYAMNIVAQIGAFISWFTIVFTGRQPEGIYQMLRLGLSYQHRAMPYGLLLTEDWPEFTQDADRRALEPHAPAGDLPAPMAAPEAPAEPAAAAPAPAEPPADAGWFEPPQPPPAEGDPPR
ncbi:MAG: DUF4389 domain-containing protein [Solirubrobacteraceae bacterium]|jgi:hypothetical protein|nr:DUF4389 domain-containing protein [Solirubrobacteraceae bacterium]